MSQNKKGPMVPMVFIWIAIALLLVVGISIVAPELRENPSESADAKDIFYDAVAADATKLHQLINNDGYKILPPASAIGARGDPFREKVKLFSKEVAEVEASLISHFANRQPENDDEMENRLQSEFNNWLVATKQYQAMVDAVLGIGTLKEEDVKEGDPHPMAHIKYFKVSGDYLDGLNAIRFALRDAEMQAFMPN